MLNSILYFEEHCIKNFEKLEDDFLKNPKNFAEYVYGLTDTLCKLEIKMLWDSLETIDRILCESSLRRRSWISSIVMKNKRSFLFDKKCGN